MSDQDTAKQTKPLDILIVDDSATMRAVIRRVIGLTDIAIGTIYEAANGQEALKILESCSIQAVFTDINMPVMTGVELLREMSTRACWNDTLRVVVSTDGSKLRREEARELNATLYIEKPFRPEVVRDVLAQITGAGAL